MCDSRKSCYIPECLPLPGSPRGCRGNFSQEEEQIKNRRASHVLDVGADLHWRQSCHHITTEGKVFTTLLLSLILGSLLCVCSSLPLLSSLSLQPNEYSPHFLNYGSSTDVGGVGRSEKYCGAQLGQACWNMTGGRKARVRDKAAQVLVRDLGGWGHLHLT